MFKAKTDPKAPASSVSSSRLRASKKKIANPAPTDEELSRQPRGKPRQDASHAQEKSEVKTRSCDVETLRETTSDEEWLNQMTQFGVAPMIAKAHIKHRHDMPELMRHHAYGWVAYHGDKPLEIGSSQAALYRKYLDQGMDLNELVVLGIGPELPATIEVDEILDF